MQYKKQIEGQRKEKGKSVEVEGVEKQKIEKILNKKNERSKQILSMIERVYGGE